MSVDEDVLKQANVSLDIKRAERLVSGVRLYSYRGDCMSI